MHAHHQYVYTLQAKAHVSDMLLMQQQLVQELDAGTYVDILQLHNTGWAVNRTALLD